MIFEKRDAQDYINQSRMTSAKRIGKRIREIRTAKGMSQSELGSLVGLSADRIHKYETGFRKPKPELLEQLADALDVDALVLADPDISTYMGAVYALFEMESLYGLRIERENEDYKLIFDSDFMNDFFEVWALRYQEMKTSILSASSEAEKEKALSSYNMWEWTFASHFKSQFAQKQTADRKAQLEDQIEKLQIALKKLENIF